MIPPKLHELLVEQYGGALAATVEAGYMARPATFRVNGLHAFDAANELAKYGISVRPVPWYGDAFITENAAEEALIRTPFYERGDFYLQSLSSMLPPLYLDPQAGETVLDMTAAPGGKTTQLYSLSGGKALITACERDKIRFERLRYNLARQGATRVTALKCDALALDDAFSFDKILLDAPCTGSGTLSPHKPARFTAEYLAKCAVLQEKLLKKALRLLKRGGTMIYSTCSVLRQENEDILKKCLGGDCISEPVTPFEGLPLLPSAAETVCICPTELYEGFFLAKIKKLK